FDARSIRLDERLQLVARQLGISPVHAARGCAVADEMLQGRDRMLALQPVAASDRALQSGHERGAQLAHKIRIFAVPFISPSPTPILWTGKARSEIPRDAGRPHLQRRSLADAADELGVVRRAKPDIVRKQRRPVYVVIAMHRIDAMQQRDAKTRLRSGL